MLYQPNAVVELGRPGLPPQRDLGDAVIEGLQDALPHARVASEQIGSGGEGLGAGPGLRPGFHRGQRLLEVDYLGSEDLQGPTVGVVGQVRQQHGYVPSRHRPVEQPAAGKSHHVEDPAGDDVEPVPHVFSDVVVGGAKSRPSDSAYSLNASVSGIEGLSNHIVSIPWTKATIPTAWPASGRAAGRREGCFRPAAR